MQLIQYAIHLSLDGGSAGLTRNQAHFANCRVPAQAAHAHKTSIPHVDDDADTALENEMHRIGRRSLARDDVPGRNLDSMAAPSQGVGVCSTAERIGQPPAQCSCLAALDPAGLYDRIFTFFQGVIEVSRRTDVTGQKPDVSERFFEFAREVDQHKLYPVGVGHLLDLREAVGSRGINAGDDAKVENQEAAVVVAREQRLDVLIEPVGGTEEKIALQVNALKLVAVRRKQCKIARTAIERRAVFQSAEAELDGVHPACAQRERGAADHYADKNAGDKAPLH